jgi:hypothetical protein
MQPEFFQRKGDSVLFTGNYMEAYIPIEYFEKGIAVENGDKIDLFAIFNFKVFSTLNPDRKSAKLLTFKFPSSIITKPHSSEDDDIELISGSGEQRYKVLKYFKNDEILTTINVVQSINNVEKFIDLLNAGKLPNTIKYNMILDLFLKNLEINKINLDVSSVVLEAMITQIYRYKDDRALPFRKVIGKNKKVTEYDYKTANMREIAELGSTFTALTFEDIDTMITASINRNLYKRQEAQSPVEKIINY